MRTVLNQKYLNLKDFVDGIPVGLFDSDGEFLHNGRNIVKLFTLPEGKFVVKKFKRPMLINRLAYTLFRGSKAKRAYRNALILKDMGVDSPDPVAYIDIFRRGLISTGYLITAFSDYSPLESLEGETPQTAGKVFEEFLRFTASLHEKGIRHDDYNTTNVRYKISDNNDPVFELIDINRMKFGPISKKDCLASIIRICDTPEKVFRVSQMYADIRGWDKSDCLAILALERSTFEKHKKNKLLLKTWLKKYSGS